MEKFFFLIEHPDRDPDRRSVIEGHVNVKFLPVTDQRNLLNHMMTIQLLVT